MYASAPDGPGRLIDPGPDDTRRSLYGHVRADRRYRWTQNARCEGTTYRAGQEIAGTDVPLGSLQSAVRTGLLVEAGAEQAPAPGGDGRTAGTTKAGP
jgi:hypothetical protein